MISDNRLNVELLLRRDRGIIIVRLKRLHELVRIQSWAQIEKAIQFESLFSLKLLFFGHITNET